MIKGALSKTTELNILANYPSGNKLERGTVVPRQMLWARLIVGSMLGLRGEGRWRGPVAAALFSVAQENMKQWRDHMDKTPVHRHVHTVSRRWLVDWLMYMHWEVDIPSALAYDPITLFGRLQKLLTKNLVHNTLSLPHAIGEMAVSTQRSPDVAIMLKMLLGADWGEWMESARTKGGVGLLEAAKESGEWKCFEKPVDASISVDSSLYKQRRLCEVLEVDSADPIGDQVRACFAQRIVDNLVARIKKIWISLPYRLLDPPEGQEDNAERLPDRESSEC